jgi:carboxypeptidase PM20D1
MRHTLRLAALALAALAGVLVVRAARLESRQVEAPPAPPLAVDAAAVSERLAGALRFATVSFDDRARMDREAFRGLHRHLELAYPRLHATLERERVGGHTLLYTWRGRDPALAPFLLMGHLDVVPIEAASAADWRHPPFGGVVADGYVWGRGAIDDKGSVVCILEAVERLAAEGFVPERTLFLVFGHDEEVGGDEGAAQAAELLAARGVTLDYVLDEGGGFAADGLPLLPGPFAPIAIAEKGSLSLELVAELAGGLSSVPPRETAPAVLAAALVRLAERPRPAALDGVTRTSLEYLAPELPLWARVPLANLWLFERPLLFGLARDPVLGALTRTTTAVTILESGVKANVIPKRALAVVNHRLPPGERIDDVIEHDRRAIADARVSIHADRRGTPREASPVSRVDGEPFARIQRTVAEIFPDATLVPALSVGGTDARHFHGRSDRVYRLTPLVVSRDDLARAHGLDERVPVAALPDAVRFYVRLLRTSAGR